MYLMVKLVLYIVLKQSSLWVFAQELKYLVMLRECSFYLASYIILSSGCS